MTDRIPYPMINMRPATIRFWPLFNTFTSKSIFSRDTQAIEFPGAIWRAAISFPQFEETDWRIWSAFVARLRGAAGRFNVGPFHALAPRGRDLPETLYFSDGTTFDDETGFYDADVVPFIRADATSTTTVLKTAGWEASQVAARRGDYIACEGSQGREMKIVVKDVTADANGYADLTIEPPCRYIPDGGTLIVIYYPSATMKLVSDDDTEMSFSAPVFGATEVELEEAFWREDE